MVVKSVVKLHGEPTKIHVKILNIKLFKENETKGRRNKVRKEKHGKLRGGGDY